MKKLLVLFASVILIASNCQQKVRELKTVTFSGNGYELGVEHGSHFKKEIAEIIEKWDSNLSRFLSDEKIEKSTDQVVSEFFEYAGFTESIKKWTPDLYEEVWGIADGSGQPFNRIFVLNLLDEFWVYLFNPKYHHCSTLGVPSINGNPGFIAQNMDIENYTDGYQTLIRIEGTENKPEQLILTHPGLIALNGMNEKGVGVSVNTLLQLKPSSSGLPVAFVVRRLIGTTDKEEILSFIKSVKHASGQNYLIGIRGEVFDFEASANKVVRFDPKNENGTIYHTNHPIVNDDLNDDMEWTSEFDPNLPDENKPVTSNSYIRFEALKSRMASQQVIGDQKIKEALRSKDDASHPVCNEIEEGGFAFTFASTIMTLTEDPYLQISAGPPNESDYERFGFK